MTLSKEARQLYDQILDEYGIDDRAGILLLQTAMESYDEMRSAQKSMNGNPVYLDRFGMPAEHPGAKIARASRTQMMSAIKKLNLDLEPLRDEPGRPDSTER